MKEQSNMDKAANVPSLFSDIQLRKRYMCSLTMILLMIGIAELLHEKEIIRLEADEVALLFSLKWRLSLLACG